MAKQQVIVPDIGADAAEVIEWMVKVGDEVAVDDSLLVLESDKASMEVPSTLAGTVVELLVNIGDSLSEGAAIVVVETANSVSEETRVVEEPAKTIQSEVSVQVDTTEVETQAAKIQASGTGKHSVLVPDIGTDDAVEVIELSVAIGDEVAEGDTLLVLESDKASMEIPADASGKVVEIAVSVGASLKQGDLIGVLEVAGKTEAQQAPTPKPTPEAPATAAPKAVLEEPKAAPVAPARVAETKAASSSAELVYAGPAVRKLAREFSIPLEQVNGSGPRGRILKEDLHAFVQQRLSKPEVASVSSGAGIPAVPAIDFSQFGPIREEALSKIGKVTAANMQRSWLNVPHVTQYDDADVTDLEAFRASLKDEAAKKGTKLTPLPFLIKACAAALKDNPKFNSSLSADGESVIYKEYVHIGFAVDTPAGLLVPVIRDVDKKGLWELAEEVLELAALARDKKLKPAQMQGACFTISSLGALGGKGFTPIVNAPEVGILGVSKSSVQPVWDGSGFVPRTMLPLSLSYDHRVINGADGGRFMNQVVALLSDIRRLTL
jgi:pyruvate dehydrogenase E2 component (dihydrolipoamide acetyltransferase)